MDKKCIVPWCNRIQNRSGKGLCRLHYDQMRKHGEILNIRLGLDTNEIIECKDHAEVIMHDRKGNETGRVLIDISDIQLVSGYHWTDNGRGYVRTFNKTTPVYMHRMIMGDIPEGLEVDHINRNKYDNRRSNLRLVTRIQNCNNRNKARAYKITNRPLSKPYVAQQTILGVTKRFGYFRSEEEAQRALDLDRIERFKIE